MQILNKFRYILFGSLLVAGCTMLGVGHNDPRKIVPKTDAEFARTAVMITNPDRTHGGTGVILESRPALTRILTNKHVCQLIQTGGKVITDSGAAYDVETFRVYKKHDLCLITIFKDLGVTVKVATHPPAMYSRSLAVGHPALLPTVMTPGHFSQWRQIELMVGVKACDGTETGQDQIACIFLGGKPIVTSMWAQLTSSLIMPGSSGSGVYNEDGELSGLIFAGSGDLGYGFLVPWEYVRDFLSSLNRYPEQKPDPNKTPENFFTSYFKFQQNCEDQRFIPAICRSIPSLGLW